MAQHLQNWVDRSIQKLIERISYDVLLFGPFDILFFFLLLSINGLTQTLNKCIVFLIV